MIKRFWDVFLCVWALSFVGFEQVIGDNNLIMGSCHIAHDCKIGDRNIFANNTLLAGHVIVEVISSLCLYFKPGFFSMVSFGWMQDYTHTAGATVVHQFCHIGSFSFIGGGSVVYSHPILSATCGYVLILLYIDFTRRSKVHDGDWRKSRTSRFESGGT